MALTAQSFYVFSICRIDLTLFDQQNFSKSTLADKFNHLVAAFF